MNSSSNIKEVQDQPKMEPEVVIEYEPEPEDYDYVAPDTEVDEEELKQLTFTGQAQDNRKLYLVIVAIVVAMALGYGVGLLVGNASIASNEVQRKSTLASTIKKQFDRKLKGFEKLVAEYRSKISEAKSFDKGAFDEFMGEYPRIDFMLDMASDISAEVVLLNEEAEDGTISNPAISKLREYSANTMLLIQLLSIHRNETTIDSEDIRILEEKPDAADVTYAMQTSPDAIFYLGKNAPREQFANGVLNIFTFREVVKDDTELSNRYDAFMSEKGWSPKQREFRNYVPTKAEAKALGDLTLPNRIMYEVSDRRGADAVLFADEVILVDRKELFGKSANALERYQQRTRQIQKIMDDTLALSATISNDLMKYMSEADIRKAAEEAAAEAKKEEQRNNAKNNPKVAE